MQDHYAVLGVRRDASPDEISRAMHQRAREHHPDLHPAAGPDELARLHAAMAAVTQAYSVLKDPLARMAYDAEAARVGSGGGRRGPAPRPSAERPPEPPVCRFCGGFPAESRRFEQQSALLFVATVRSIEARLCRDCARAIGRSMQHRTLWRGWWGVVAGFRNLGVVARNARELRRAHTMRPRAGTIGIGALRPGRPVLLRSGSLFVALVVLWIAGAVLAGRDGAPAPRRPLLPPALVTSSYAIGSCVDGIGVVEPVTCALPHSGRIVGQVGRSQACPPPADAYVDVRADRWCVDLDT